MKKILTGGITFGLLAFACASSAFAASLSLSPASATKNVGDTFRVDIILDTQGDAVSGATAIINYDKSRLSVVDGDTAASGVNIKPNGSTLSQVLTNKVDASKGQIRYDAGNLGSNYTGRGVIATITFQATSVGAAQASFVFNQNATTNTSAVAAASGPTNLLEEINDGNFTINAGGASDDEPLLETGVVEDTLLLIFGGLGFLGFGGFLARKAWQS